VIKKILMLLAISGIASLAMAQEVRRPSGRVMPSVVDSRCQYVESMWGSRCEVTPEICLLTLVPLFVETTNTRVVVKLLNNISVEPEETVINFNIESTMAIKYTWVGSEKVKWVEWYTRDPSREYPELPLQGCYCNELEAKIYICRSGQVEEE
jgi:hypothetical protein